MKLDPTIVEAVARALARQRLDFNSRHREPLTPDRYKASEDAGWPNFVPEASVALAAAAPLIEAAVLEKAAKVAEQHIDRINTAPGFNRPHEIATTIRALKEQP
jgi:hypothetical protein